MNKLEVLELIQEIINRSNFNDFETKSEIQLTLHRMIYEEENSQ